MESLLKTSACLLLAVLLTVQLLLTSPYRAKLTDDTINGRTLKLNESLIYRGTVTLDVLGKYTPNSAVILINGEPQKTVDAFPVELNVCDGDVVEVQSKLGALPFYLILASHKGLIATDLKESTILIYPGVNHIFKVTPLKG